MISNAKTFFISLFLIAAIVLPKSIFAGPITITAASSLPAQVEVDSQQSFPGTYIVKAAPYQTMVFKNNFPPSVIQLAQGSNPCQLGTHTMSSQGVCAVTLGFTPPSLVGNVNPRIGACYKDTISCAKYDVSLKIVSVPPPTVTAVNPNSGSVGDNVEIIGTNFKTGAVIKFGGVIAASNFVSDTKIDATVPAGSGTIDVTVTTNFGESSKSSAGQYTYIVPTQEYLEIQPDGGGAVLNKLKLAVGVPLTVELHNIGSDAVNSLTWNFPAEVSGTIVPEIGSTCVDGNRSLVGNGFCKLTFTANSSSKFTPIGQIEITGNAVPPLKLLVDTFDKLCVGTDTSICRVFLSNSHDGDFGGIDGAHTFCNNQAQTKGYLASLNWKAMLATYNSGDPSWKSMTVQIEAQLPGMKYVNPESPMVGSDPGDIWYTSDNLIQDEVAINGAGLVGSAWTGGPTTNNPPSSNDETCKDWTSNLVADTSVLGDLALSKTDDHWPQKGNSGIAQSCSGSFPVLCVEVAP